MPTLSLPTLALIFLAGGLGSLSRFALSSLIQSLQHTANASKPTFPLATLTVNVLGSFLFGLIFAAATHRHLLSPDTRLIILVGFMGAFTTFSTFSFESITLFKHAPFTAILYILASVALSILACAAGLALFLK